MIPAFRYYRTSAGRIMLTHGSQPGYLAEVKGILIGQPQTGKTSVARLLAPVPPMNIDVAIHDVALAHPTGEGRILMRMWDLDGATVGWSAQQLFITTGAVYVLVWDPRKGLEQNEIETWLRRVRHRVRTSARVVLVSTYAEVENRTSLDYGALEKEFTGLLAGRCAVDTATGQGRDDLRHVIALAATGLSGMNGHSTTAWAAARAAVARTAAPFLEFEAFTDLCRENGVTQEDAADLAQLMHHVGQAVYDGADPALRDLVVMDPFWLGRAVRHILADQDARDAKGIIDHARIRKIWDQHGYDRSLHPYLLRAMEKWDIAFPLEGAGTSSVVTQLMPYQRADTPWDAEDPSGPEQRVLRLDSELSEAVPSGLIAGMVARHHSEAAGRFWRTGLFLRQFGDSYDAEALLEVTAPNKLSLEVRGSTSDNYFNVLRYGLDTVLAERWRTITRTHVIPCPTITTTGLRCSGSYDLDKLNTFRSTGGVTVVCQRCGHDHDVSALLTGFPTPDRPAREIVAHISVSTMDLGDASAPLTMARFVAYTEGQSGYPCQITYEEVPLTWAWHRLGRRAIRLYVWCQCPGHEHAMDQAYDFAWWTGPARRVERHLGKILFVLRVGLAIATLPDPFGLASERAKTSADTVLHEDGRTREAHGKNGPPARGRLLAALQWAVKIKDPDREFRGLRPMPHSTDSVLWMCPTHRSPPTGPEA